jgi:hypothetical protein
MKGIYSAGYCRFKHLSREPLTYSRYKIRGVRRTNIEATKREGRGTKAKKKRSITKRDVLRS